MFLKPDEKTPKAKPLVFVLSRDKRLPDDVYQDIENHYRPIEYKGQPHEFDCTGYYEKEFGPALYRHIICFRNLIDPAELVSLKWMFYEIEQEHGIHDIRKYNLDFGYLDTDKLVLASFKRGKNKLYLGREVYGDMLMEYAKGLFSPMPWAFSDFKDSRYHKDLMVIREKLKADLRKH